MNWFKYRLPNTSITISGGSKRILKGLAEGFVIAPFINPDEGLITIPYDNPDSLPESKAEISAIPVSTPREEYDKEVNAIIQAIGDSRGKTVAARTIRLNETIDLDATFENLCSAYPEAFVFMFSSPVTGTWIGASPELLTRKEGDYLLTMALAGTRPRSDEDYEWDVKNIDEQAMVTEFIVKTLLKHCSTVTTGKTFTKKAGPVEHICTPVFAHLPDSLLSDEYEDSHNNRIRRILTDLSPTPALCGSDRARSLEIIGKCERFKREMYGGFCGPNSINGISAFFVNLRCAKVAPDSAVIYIGGGITNLSNPETEWLETEMKSKTIINKLKTSEK